MTTTKSNAAATHLPSEIARWVAAGIIGGRWSTGQRMNEVHLAKELGVSRAPVREALRRLEEQGMVTHRARIGCVVNPFTPTTVGELYDLRVVIERWYASEGTRQLTDEDVEQLRRYLTPLEAAWARNDHPAFYSHAWAMREIIYGRAESALALNEIRRLRDRLHSLPLVLHDIPDHSAWVLQQHRELVDAVEARDPERVAEAIVRMLRAAGDIVTRAFERSMRTKQAPQGLQWSGDTGTNKAEAL